MMNPGTTYKCGEIVLANIQFVDRGEIKKRPALVLFEEYTNIVVAGITSNPAMKGITLGKEEGLHLPSIIKLNYIFTISPAMIEKRLGLVSLQKKKQVQEYFLQKLQ